MRGFIRRLLRSNFQYIYNYMKYLRNFKIQTRLLFGFIFISFVPLLVTGISSFTNSSQAINYKISIYSEQVMNQISQNIELELYTFSRMLSEVGLTPEVQDNLPKYAQSSLMDKYYLNDTICNKVLRPKFASFKDITDVELITDDGKERLGLAGIDRSADALWKKQTIDNLIKLTTDSIDTQVRFDTLNTSNEANFIISREVKSKVNGKRIGAIFLAVKEKYFSSIYGSTNLGVESADIFIISSNGRVVSSRNPNIPVGKPYKDASLIGNILKNEKKTFSMRIGREDYLVAFSKINRTDDWYLVSTIPFSYLNKESNTILTNSIFTILACILLALLLSLSIYKSISAPLNNLVGQMGKIINMDKGELSVQIQDNSKDEIGRLSRSFQGMLEALNKMWKEVKESRDTIEEWNKHLEKTVKQKTAEIKNILNNAGQGFLTFGEDLVIKGEYSSECVKIFERQIKNRKFSELVAKDNEEQKEFLDSIFVTLLNEKDPYNREVYLPLLPDEVIICDKHIYIEYKIVNDIENIGSKKMMIILTDETVKRALEKQMEQEKNILKMVVNTVVNYNQLSQSISDYQNFCNFDLSRMFDSDMPIDDVVFEVFRQVHTFKGNFAQLEMVNIVHRLHEFESQISYISRNTGDFTIDQIQSYFLNIDFIDWLEEDLSILKNILGEQYFEQKNVAVVDKIKLVEIEKKMLEMLSPTEYSMLVPEIRKIRYSPFKDLIKAYPQYTLKLAERQEKLIHEFDVEGGEFILDDNQFVGFSKSLTHIFRNIIEHGIESPEERMDQGKNEFGNIACSVYQSDNSFTLFIADDGRGINIEKIRRTAANKGLITLEKANSISDNEIMEYIFMDGFSTNETVSELSGRGVGLSAVKSEVEKLGGTIHVETSQGQGTEFRITIPFNSTLEVLEAPADAMIQPIISSTVTFFKKQTDINLCEAREFLGSRIGKIPLNSITSFIHVRGGVNGMFILSMDEELAKRLVDNLVIEDVPEEQFSAFSEDTVAECSNVIIGNSLNMLGQVGDMMTIESPVVVKSSQATLKYAEDSVWAYSLDSDSGSISLGFVALNG